MKQLQGTTRDPLRQTLVFVMSLAMVATSLLVMGTQAFAIDKFAVQKTADNPSITAGQNASFTIVATAINTGTGNIVENFTLTDQLSAGTWTVGGPDAGTCSVNGSNLLTCLFGDVPEGQTRTITVSRTTSSGDCNTTITNTAKVTSDDLAFESGTDLVDNTSTASITVSCGTPPPPPCLGQTINFRWHYSANGSSGSWSGTKSTVCDGSTFTMGPQAMEGDLKVTPGTTLMTGYDFTIPGNTATLSVTVNNPQVVFTVRCVSGAAPTQSTLTVPMTTATYTVTNSAWYPSGDQHSPLVYQGSITMPDLCAGGQVRLDKGGTFSASVS